MARYAIIDLDKTTEPEKAIAMINGILWQHNLLKEERSSAVLSHEETEANFKEVYMKGCDDAFDYDIDPEGNKFSTTSETWKQFKKTL